jgi:Tol biopolymer transport system component
VTYSLVLADSDGTNRVISDGQQSLRNPRFSADGERVVVAAARPGDKSTDLWLHDLAAGTATRVTFEGAGPPVWSPDGSSVSYSRQSAKPPGIYDVRADGSGDERNLVGLDTPHWLVGWTPDRQTLAYGVMEGSLSSIVSRRGNETHRVVGPGQTWGGRLSRDGRWLVYYSLDSGNFEVYVTPFPEGDARWLIANGTDPTWSPDGSEVYYRSVARLMAARIDRSKGVRVLSHRIVIEPFQPPVYDDYDIRSDGTVVMVRPSSPTQGREVTMVHNWFSDLRRLTGQP